MFFERRKNDPFSRITPCLMTKKKGENNPPHIHKLALTKLTTNYHVLRSLVPRFDLQAIDFVILDANSQINFQLHPQNHRIHGNRGCLGCCTKTPFVTTDNNKTTGNLGKGQATNRHSIFEDFCSTSTYDMDNSITQFQISASSTSNAAMDPSEFVNRGLLLWNQTRQQWIGDKAPNHNKKARQPVISWNATYDNMLGSNKPFSRPIPLPEMVNFLVDIWEQEGLYD